MGAVKTFLYRLGDECSDMTGGWQNVGYHRGSEHVFEKGANYLLAATDATLVDDYRTGINGTTKTSTTTLSCVNAIPFKKGQTLKILCDIYCHRYNTMFCACITTKCVDSNNLTTALGTYTDIASIKEQNTKRTLLTYTFTEDTTAHIAFVLDRWATMGGAGIKIHQMWLEG
jgi:hypothetical protein